jgi:hypothetical protein
MYVDTIVCLSLTTHLVQGGGCHESDDSGAAGVGDDGVLGAYTRTINRHWQISSMLPTLVRGVVLMCCIPAS